MHKKKPSPQKNQPPPAAAVAGTLAATKPPAHFPIVGIGASAGGLAAFEAFFSGMPAETDPGMAFVLVQHLSPDHSSILADLIRRYTRMPVCEVEDGMVAKPNCVYIIPPGYDMAFLNGVLQLLARSEPHGLRLPIDFFFSSLAQDQRERAIGIVLSGTGSDGTLGVRAIKGEGGLVMVQNTASSEFDGMPRSAIATGLVDYELPPAEMPAQLITYTTHAFANPLKPNSHLSSKSENALKKIFILLRAQTGHDFSQYKSSTVNRRIERRMAVHQIKEVDAYVKFLHQSPVEVEALFRDMLIGVTHFFRDPLCFQVLEDEVLPKLFVDRHPGSALRIWSVGCSTGEEAYSLAILLVERMEKLRQNYTVQIFATDIDSQAIATARSGLYPASIAADISPERLARFFTSEADGSAYRIQKGIRDLLVFSVHDVIKDPPFSRLDLISCRNLLIYLNPDLQRKLIPLFHYAMQPGGMLFLGSSEGIGEGGDLFAVLDRTSKIYARKNDRHGPRRLAINTIDKFLSPPTTIDSILPSRAEKTAAAINSGRVSLRELTEMALVQHVVAAGVLVNGQGDILYLHGRTGLFLEPAQGEAGINNILKMAREGLHNALASTLHKAVHTQALVRAVGLRVKTNGDHAMVNLSIRPVIGHADAKPLYLVVLEEAPELKASSPPDATAGNDPSDAEAQIAALQQKLHDNEEYLQNIHEELQSSSEELKSTNEEMQSVNEELQSTNEELETSKEELQSVNEELATINAELQTKVTDLTRSNNDMNNLLAGTGIGTVFVDYQLRILRFTPAASSLINLILSDVGRPVAHIVSNLVGYDRLVADIQAVLDTLIPKEVEVQTITGAWFTMRVIPYRTLDNVIEGAVISFVDITAMKAAQQKLREANDLRRLAVVVRDAHDAITVQDLDGNTLAWNPGAVRAYGWSEAEALAMNVHDRIPQDLREDALAQLTKLSHAEILEPYNTRRLARDGTSVEVSIISTALINEAGEFYAIATTERQIRQPS